jgi:hypothetical protein
MACLETGGRSIWACPFFLQRRATASRDLMKNLNPHSAISAALLQAERVCQTMF